MRVVLVDPSRTVLKFVGRLLEAREHEVRAFTDGRAALAYIRSDSGVGALVTSAELTSMSGMELCWEVRLLAMAGRPIYVILMSSSEDRHKLIEALDSGADDYIGKPPIAEELYARLRAAERVATMQRELLRLATTDPLTGLLNRRAFFEQASEACARAAARGALCAVAAEAAAESAIVGRLGGEEFAILLDGRGLEQAIEVGERLRWKMAALRFKTGKGPMTLTCSFGIGAWER